MADITFKGKRVGKQMSGTLEWAEQKLSAPAISGPHGNGALPAGTYSALRENMLDKEDDPKAASYADSHGTKRGHCWMLPISNFGVRTDLGIHPDGGDVGTQGCIGLRIKDSKPWYDAFWKLDKKATISIVVIDEP
jgi:hypothetical protein